MDTRTKEVLDEIRFKVAKEIANKRTLLKYLHSKEEASGVTFEADTKRYIHEMLVWEEMRDYLDELWVRLEAGV